tara:strand:+ start:68 stop:172 length:105 start_codon:yes stop_codon:yes gene_type:complete
MSEKMQAGIVMVNHDNKFLDIADWLVKRINRLMT